MAERVKRRNVAVLLAAITVAASFGAFAVLLTLNEGQAAGGSTTVPKCDTDGYTLNYTVNATFNVTQVQLDSINTACNGGNLSVTLADGSGASLGGGSANISGARPVLVNIASGPDANLVAQIHVVITE